METQIAEPSKKARAIVGKLASSKSLLEVLRDGIVDYPCADGEDYVGYLDDEQFLPILEDAVKEIRTATSIAGLKVAVRGCISYIGLRLAYGTDQFDNDIDRVRIQAALEVGKASCPAETVYWDSVSVARQIELDLSSLMRAYREVTRSPRGWAWLGPHKLVHSADDVLLELLACLVRRSAALEDLYPGWDSWGDCIAPAFDIDGL